MTTERAGYRPEGIDDAFVSHDDDAPEATGGAPAGGTDGGEGGGAGGGRPAAPVLPTLGWRGWLRWMWRQLTSMRVALVLLMLLAVAAVPGSILPQRPVDPSAVLTYLQDNPTAGKILDKLGFFDVFSSVWFSAIYLLLFVSLVGCILPRAVAHGKNLRSRPPRVPRKLDRFPARADGTTERTPDEVVDAAVRHLRGRVRWLPTFRVETGTDAQGRRTVAAERGYLRESGNIVFHLCLVGLLVSVGVGQALHYRGQVIVTEGRGFANAVVDYDTFESGRLFRASTLDPFSMTLDRFTSEFTNDATAEPRDFTAFVTTRDPDTGKTTSDTIRVNHPLDVDGSKVYLQGNGYAPVVTVKDAKGQVAYSGPVVFVPQDSKYTSRGVIKVPDVSKGLEQLGLVGFLLPTAASDDTTSPSIYPQPLNPLLVLNVWHGDLGLDQGLPQNVYRLDTSGMKESVKTDGQPVTLTIQPGETVKLPDGMGTITFDSLPRYVALDLRYDPALTWVLVFALGALFGLALSLFTPRRRVWLRVTTDGDPAAGSARTVIEAAGLARGDDSGLQREVDAALAAATGDTDRTTGTTASAANTRKATR
ncbi:cytochrome c biogenesis protein ResB [Luteimicrobium subarcticum]|uniref:Cytochrome c biogenesis protein n=1 Tax=Luteimicrobium subarcticum TaxID=620910 RepID=A0A2M8WVT4_9MICO|nr:cytochrome c biogenesis protein ResB [Luteimicrobium subarcticum]PJI95016.1 cytochrome c biogenesis protein [Luteimicrobium subarcticum]